VTLIFFFLFSLSPQTTLVVAKEKKEKNKKSLGKEKG